MENGLSGEAISTRHPRRNRSIHGIRLNISCMVKQLSSELKQSKVQARYGKKSTESRMARKVTHRQTMGECVSERFDTALY